MSQLTSQPIPAIPPTAPSAKLSRRKLFAGASAVGAAAAAVTLLPALRSEGPAESAVVKPMPEKGGGYTLSERVKQYYKTTLV